jgi:hypothetical protein
MSTAVEWEQVSAKQQKAQMGEYVLRVFVDGGWMVFFKRDPIKTGHADGGIEVAKQRSLDFVNEHMVLLGELWGPPDSKAN